MHIINNPVGLYYNGELIGVITNPDPVPGGIGRICEVIEQGLDEICEIRPLDDPCDHIASAIENLPESIPVDTEDECA
tara:strand:+ start:2615 stop:2848 length:234 start_codon:yes stop_codon:yes gene_type:complete